MKKTLGKYALIGSTLVAATLATVSPSALAADAKTIEEGKKIAFHRGLGNCLACHVIAGGEQAGNFGPPLVAMQARYPDKAKLRDKIWGAPHSKVPYSAMPQFGKNGILTESQIDKVVEFIYTL